MNQGRNDESLGVGRLQPTFLYQRRWRTPVDNSLRIFIQLGVNLRNFAAYNRRFVKHQINKINSSEQSAHNFQRDWGCEVGLWLDLTLAIPIKTKTVWLRTAESTYQETNSETRALISCFLGGKYWLLTTVLTTEWQKPYQTGEKFKFHGWDNGLRLMIWKG